MAEWHDILEKIGWPISVLVIDFESYFDVEYSLKKMSTIEYVLDKRFDCLGVAHQYLDVDGYGEPGFIDKLGLRDWLSLELDFSKLTIVCHNAKFDISILYHHFNINPPYVIDTRDLSRHLEARAKHSLAECVRRYGLPDKGTELDSLKGLHYEDMDVGQQDRLADYSKNDAKITADLFKTLLPKISNPHIELRLARHTLDMYLDARLKFDFPAAEQLMKDMQREMDEAIYLAGYPKDEISGTISFVKLLQQALPEGESVPTKEGKPTKNMIPLLGPGLIPAVSKDDEGAKQLQKHGDPEVRDLIEARLAIKSWPLHVGRIVNLTNQAKARSGYLGIPLHYYGGHTGRWSGAEKINTQNFGTHGHELVKKTKSLILAPPGHKIIGVDQAQIEARVLACMAGQTDLVEDFRQGKDVYSSFATELFDSYVRKPNLFDPPGIAKLLYVRRALGKQSILGLGYGMGAETFLERCEKNHDLAPLVKVGEIDADMIVDTYRGKYTKIIKFWNSVENAFRWCTKYPSQMGANERLKCGLGFWSDGSTTCLQLPSGRVLHYQDVRITKDGIKWKYGGLWGSALVENIVQAVSRDIIAEQMLHMIDLGLYISLPVHDSLAIIIPEDRVKGARVSIGNVMRTPSSWMPDVPLNIELGVSDCYE